LIISNKKGFTLIEAVASIFIIASVLAVGITILMNIRIQGISTQRRILAVEVGSLIRDDIITSASYDEVALWLDGSEKILNSTNCQTSGSPFSCDSFLYTLDGISYDENVVITFLAPTIQSEEYHIIHFSVVIEYYSLKTIELEGILYDETIQ